MASGTKDAPPLRFRGIPQSLTGVVPDRDDGDLDVGVSFRRPGADEPEEVAVSYDPDPRVLRLSLPSDVGPGTYAGTLRMGTGERAVELEVEAAPGLRVIPEQLRIGARPGQTVDVELVLLNHGNVPVEVRRTQAIGIFMQGGVERALHRAYVEKLEKGQRRVDVLAETLAEAHAGLVKMRLRKGYGSVAPGELRQLAASLDVPAGAAAGRTYGGNWELANLVYPVTITVLDDGDGEEPGEGEG